MLGQESFIFLFSLGDFSYTKPNGTNCSLINYHNASINTSLVMPIKQMSPWSTPTSEHTVPCPKLSFLHLTEASGHGTDHPSPPFYSATSEPRGRTRHEMSNRLEGTQAAQQTFHYMARGTCARIPELRASHRDGFCLVPCCLET